MALFGSIETVRAQAPQSLAFATAWAYVEQLLRSGSAVHGRVAGLGEGVSQRHELDHGVFAIEQAYRTKRRPDGFFESHRKYIDIQVIVAGEEVMEVVDAGRATVREAYNAERDYTVWNDVASASSLRVLEGEATIFFPVDVHMPSLQLGAAPVLVRKSVLKVPVGA